MKLDKKTIIKQINLIRREIGHDNVKINIKKLIYDKKYDELWIITPDRPDKSSIIGKGGWVVGKLREKMKINKIHVESYSDYLIKEYRMKLSLQKLDSFIKEQENEKSNQSFLTPIENLKSILEAKIENIYNFDFTEYFNNHDYEFSKNENNAIVALSGGVDSSFSLVIAKKLGFNPIAVTIDPGTIILPKQFKDNIKKLCKEISVKHKYIPMDYTEIIQDSLSGNLHPCGRCSKETASALFNYGKDNNINLVIFGDMLSTGSQCITKYKINKTINNKFNKDNENNEDNNEVNENNKEINENNNKINENNNKRTNKNNENNNFDEDDLDMFRLNLPATLSVGKEEIKKNILKYNLEQIKGFGCPLLYESHKEYPYFKKFSIQRILRETRSGALEPGEALDLIWSFYRTEK